MNADDHDVPSPIDLRDKRDARTWAASAMVKRPWRVSFFAAFAEELSKFEARSVLELGSGPGFLAGHLLGALPTISYCALDFSAAMHDLARERLGDLCGRVRFEVRDFKDPAWSSGLGVFDAVISMQAIHEVRHKSHVPELLLQVRRVARPHGLFLMCDHEVAPEGMSDRELYMTRREQEEVLTEAGFTEISIVRAERGLVMWRAS